MRQTLSRTVHTIPEGFARCRADRALAAAFPEHSRSQLQRAFEAGLVEGPHGTLAKSDLVRAGDRIRFELPGKPTLSLEPAAIPLDVVFEDECLIAINKAAGMVVHPGAGTRGDTLVHALLAHGSARLSSMGGAERPGIVHRLDRGTSGLILVAKTDAAHRSLAAQFAARTVLKEYLALVRGSPRLESGSVTSPIGRDRAHRQRMAVVPVGRGGRAAHTDWRVVERLGWASLLRCRIRTGRTHQIRVHLKSTGHVLVGDVTYGWKASAGDPVAGRPMLHAEHLVIAHPATGAPLELRAPLPDDFQRLLRSREARPQRRL